MGCFFNNINKAHALNFNDLCNFISLWAFTAYMGNSLQFEISLWSN